MSSGATVLGLVMKSAVIVFPGIESRARHGARRSKPSRARAARWSGTPRRELPAGTDLVVLPGGFSYGDYLRCGAIAARAPVMAAVRAHAAQGRRWCSASATASRSCARRGCCPAC